MSLEWKTVELKSIADVTMGQSPKSEFYNDNFEGMPFLQGNKTFGDKYPSFELYTTSIKKVAEKSSVLMSVRAPVGDLNIAKEDICIGRGVCGIRMKKGDNEFLYYLLKANISHLINKESGTVFGSINKNDIETFEVTLPEDFEDQMKILTILKNIDKKIEVCKDLNKNLTNIVLLLFKNWFVDFNFLNENNKPYKNDNGELKDSILGLIPKDWNVDSLGKYVEIDRGFSYKGKYLSEEGIPLINLGNILPNSEFRLEKLKFYSGEFDKKYKVNVGDILVANTDLTQNRLVLGSPIIVPSLIDEKDIIYSHHINRLSNFKLPKFYIFYNLLSERYNHMVSGYATGTTVLAISKESITNYKILIPPEELIFKFDELAKNIEKIKDNNLIEMEKLTKLRNILLPKLMSGEIDVSQLDYLNDSIER